MRTGPEPFGLLVLGCSTGGPEALAQVIPRLPGDTPVPVVIVQHMSRLFTPRLADRQNAASALRVAEARSGARLVPGLAVVAPGDRHILVERTPSSLLVRASFDPPLHSVRPSLDILLRSAVAAEIRCLVVVMTGMGVDGVEGCAAVRKRGGQVLVQDRATSVIWGMPGAVARARHADRVLPLGALARAIRYRLGR